MICDTAAETASSPQRGEYIAAPSPRLPRRLWASPRAPAQAMRRKTPWAYLVVTGALAPTPDGKVRTDRATQWQWSIGTVTRP